MVLEGFPEVFHQACVRIASAIRCVAKLRRCLRPSQRFAVRSGVIRLLVIGGSLGARRLNSSVPRAIALLQRQGHRFEVWHQAGERGIEEARREYSLAGVNGRVEAFIEDMASAYGWADLVICRAGALTVAELAAAGVRRAAGAISFRGR